MVSECSWKVWLTDSCQFNIMKNEDTTSDTIYLNVIDIFLGNKQ